MTFVRRCFAAAGALVMFGMVMVLSASPVWAHIELAESDPTNFSTVDQPVEVVRLTFSGQAEAVTDQFSIEDPDGNAVGIVSIEPEGGDGATLAVTPAHALGGGRHRVTWAIRSGDSHTMTGTVSFTVTAPAVAPAAEGADVAPPSTIATAAGTERGCGVGFPGRGACGDRGPMARLHRPAVLRRWPRLPRLGPSRQCRRRPTPGLPGPSGRAGRRGGRAGRAPCADRRVRRRLDRCAVVARSVG